MLKKTLYSLAFGCLFSVTAYAETPSSASIEQLIDITDSKQQYEQELQYSEQSYNDMMQQLIDSQKNYLAKKDQEKFNTLQKEMLALMMKESQWEHIKPTMIQIFQEVYTQEEVNSMIEYYKTPIGRSILKKMPLVTEKNNAFLQQQMEKFMPQFIEQLQQFRSKK